MATETDGWIQTFTGRKFYPLDPDWQRIDIHDIAHALSNLCRYGGHVEQFYSVAQHSVFVSRVCAPEDALWGLLHDASEAYLVDLPRPIKRQMPTYREAEERLQFAIGRTFNLPLTIPASVMRADNVLLVTEQRDLMKVPPEPWTDYKVSPLEGRIEPLSPADAKRLFLKRFDELVVIPKLAVELGVV